MQAIHVSIVITDTSVLINFLNLDEIKLLAQISYKFMITEHVFSEVTEYYSIQLERLKKAIKEGHIEIIRVDQPEELELFEKFSTPGRLGAGECSAIACAINRSYLLAIDDRRARKQALKLHPELKILTTQDLLIQLVKEKIITAQRADEIKRVLENRYRFTMNVNSFTEMVS
ncbi:MAG: hypothetical protein WC748_06775 [Legionellales bacterium]|jgi:hypothetical protein